MIKNSVCDTLATESDNIEDSAVYKLPVKKSGNCTAIAQSKQSSSEIGVWEIGIEDQFTKALRVVERRCFDWKQSPIKDLRTNLATFELDLKVFEEHPRLFDIKKNRIL